MKRLYAFLSRNRLTIYFFPIKYKYDIGAFLIAAVLAFLSFKYTPSPKTGMIISFAVLFAYLIFIIYLREIEKELYFISLASREHIDEFIGTGDFIYDKAETCYMLTNAHPGYIHKKTLSWSDYRYSFRFKIIKECIGVVVRASDLYNYIMLQIRNDRVRPHIYRENAFKVWEPDFTGLKFETPLSPDKWYDCEIQCQKRRISIKILLDKKSIFNREWNIPLESFQFEFPFKDQSGKFTTLPLSTNMDYGAVGFRNWDKESALVRDVLIQKL